MFLPRAVVAGAGRRACGRMEMRPRPPNNWKMTGVVITRGTPETLSAVPSPGEVLGRGGGLDWGLVRPRGRLALG